MLWSNSLTPFVAPVIAAGYPPAKLPMTAIFAGGVDAYLSAFVHKNLTADFTSMSGPENLTSGAARYFMAATM
nr:hypothetical protein [uncultured Campylobacter sp.]